MASENYNKILQTIMALVPLWAKGVAILPGEDDDHRWIKVMIPKSSEEKKR